jgi:hypothetical protein
MISLIISLRIVAQLWITLFNVCFWGSQTFRPTVYLPKRCITKITVLWWDAAPCSLVKITTVFRVQGDDWCSKQFWDAGKLLPDYIPQHSHLHNVCCGNLNPQVGKHSATDMTYLRKWEREKGVCVCVCVCVWVGGGGCKKHYSCYAGWKIFYRHWMFIANVFSIFS